MEKENKFAQRLKELRQELGLSQRELAEKIGCAKSSIGDWETRNKETNYDMLFKLARFFKVSIDFLLGFVDL